jgi:hypothetical protein
MGTKGAPGRVDGRAVHVRAYVVAVRAQVGGERQTSTHPAAHGRADEYAILSHYTWRRAAGHSDAVGSDRSRQRIRRRWRRLAACHSPATTVALTDRYCGSHGAAYGCSDCDADCCANSRQWRWLASSGLRVRRAYRSCEHIVWPGMLNLNRYGFEVR